MDFFAETKQKAQAMKEFVKRRMKPIAVVAAAGVSCCFSSCTEMTVTESYTNNWKNQWTQSVKVTRRSGGNGNSIRSGIRTAREGVRLGRELNRLVKDLGG